MLIDKNIPPINQDKESINESRKQKAEEQKAWPIEQGTALLPISESTDK